MPTAKALEKRRVSLGTVAKVTLNVANGEKEDQNKMKQDLGSRHHITPPRNSSNICAGNRNTSCGKAIHSYAVLRSDITPGKKGGNYPLPEGGRVIIPEGTFVRKDTISILVVPPSKHYSYTPSLVEQESLVSPVYVVQSSLLTIDLPITVKLPVLSNKDHRNSESGLSSVIVRAKLNRPVTLSEEESSPDHHDAWVSVPILSQDAKFVTFETKTFGTFVLVNSPKCEEFEVNPNGGLLNLKLNPLISIRVPKRSYLNTNVCQLAILPMHKDRFDSAKTVCPSETSDIVAVSPIYRFDFPPVEFKRIITVRLPLPEWMESTDEGSAVDADLFVIMHKFNDKWNILDPGTSLKFTKNSVTFDYNMLTRFMFVKLTKSEKAQRARLAIPLLEEFNNMHLGEILIFASLEKTRWTLCAECVPQANIINTISDRVQTRGWVFLQRLSAPDPQQDSPSRSFRRRGSQQSLRKTSPLEAPGLVRFQNGASYNIKISGDFEQKVSTDDDLTEDESSMIIQFHNCLKDKSALFEIVPTEKARRGASDYYTYLLEQEEEKMNGIPFPTSDSKDNSPVSDNEAATQNGEEKIVFKANISVENSVTQTVIQQHLFSIDFSDMKTYLDLKPPPPPEPEPLPDLASEVESMDMTASTKPTRVAQKPVKPKMTPEEVAKAREESFMRLTKPKKNTTLVSREPKVLNRRSLQHLAAEIRQGLTLAVHLNLPESAITGIGFDALSGGSSMAEVTYKVLQLWKRGVSGRGWDGMVDQLSEALTGMGRNDLVPILTKQHQANQELSPDCFQVT